MSGGSDRAGALALERLIFFSDAVFAIAITLLIIEVHVPRLPQTAGDAAFMQALSDLWPSFMGYGIGFAVIGTFWRAHHRAFGLAGSHDERVIAPNLLLLALIAFMPFATGFMSANVGQRVPTTFYAFFLFLTGLASLRVVWLATSPPVVRADAPRTQIAYARQRGLSFVLGAVLAIGFCLARPNVGLVALLSIPLWRRALQRFWRS